MEEETVIQNKSFSFEDLYSNEMIHGFLPVDPNAEHKLLDRIICVRENLTVPIGSRGTLIGIQKKMDKWQYVYEVLFDKPFKGEFTNKNGNLNHE